MRNSVITGRYRHYKGNEYEVIGEAIHTETEEKLVIYRSLYAPYYTWARPYDMFFSQVIIDGQSVPRFENRTTNMEHVTRSRAR